MASGKSIENRYNAPEKTYENLTKIEGSGVLSFFGRPATFRNAERPARKNMQLEQRRAAKARARANGKR